MNVLKHNMLFWIYKISSDKSYFPKNKNKNTVQYSTEL